MVLFLNFTVKRYKLQTDLYARGKTVDNRAFFFYTFDIMEIKKTGKLNILGSGLAFLITVYTGIIFILLMAGNTPDSIGYEISSSHAGYWAFPFVLCIFMYLACIVNVVAIPTYYALKSKNSSSPIMKYTAVAQVIASIVILLVVIMFWSWQGGIWNGNANTPFATPYRIIELCLSIAQIGLIFLTIFYSPRSDTIRQLKNRQKKKAKEQTKKVKA